MTAELYALTFTAAEPRRLAGFWHMMLGWELVDDYHGDGAALLPRDDIGYRLRFRPGPAGTGARNRMHFDLTSTSLEDQRETVRHALALGARHLDVGQLPDEEHVVLADPGDNAFCVIEPGNEFLAECGRLGALACDGSREVGHFWSEALGWPLVWEHGQETAIRSPRGGPKITWDGVAPPPTGEQRVRFDVLAQDGGDHRAEVERLLSLGATRTGEDAGGVILADPDGNGFCVLRDAAS